MFTQDLNIIRILTVFVGGFEIAGLLTSLFLKVKEKQKLYNFLFV